MYCSTNYLFSHHQSFWHTERIRRRMIHFKQEVYMHRNERYFDKNEGKHNFFGQLDNDEIANGNRENQILENKDNSTTTETEDSDP